MEYLLGIDLGSTSIKAVVFDTNGVIVASGSTPTVVSRLDADHPSWAVWDPKIIWESVCTAVHGALKTINDTSSIRAVSVTGWGMDGLPMGDKGEWLYPFISWHCPRTEGQSRAFKERIGSEKIFSITGTQVLSIHSVYRMMWMYENHPEIMEKTKTWLLIEDFINFMLCGEVATDFSMASCTALLDLHSGTWSDELAGLAGVDRSILPPIRPSGTLLGKVHRTAASATGLREGTAVVLGGHDYHCAGLACGALKPGVILDITGTWEILFTAAKNLNLSKEVFEAGLLVEKHVVRNMNNVAAFAVSAGMLEWFISNYCSEEERLANAGGATVWEALMKLAEAVPAGSRGVHFLPHFSGAVTPHVDNRSLGAFVGLSDVADKGTMIRALIEGLDYQFLEFLVNFEKALGTKVDKIVVAGGAARNAFWMQNKADVSGIPVEISSAAEATPLGAAMLAGIGSGIYRDEAQAFNAVTRPGKIYEPDRTIHEKYSKYYEIYQMVYPGLKEISHVIFDTFHR